MTSGDFKNKLYLEYIIDWKFCISTFLFAVILASLTLYSVDLMTVESAAHIVLIALILFAIVQVFTKKDHVYSIRSIYEWIKHKINGLNTKLEAN